MPGLSRRFLFPLCALMVGAVSWSGPVAPAAFPGGSSRIEASRSGAQVAFPGGNGRIAFDRDGVIYTMRPDGTGLRRIVGRGAADPVWGPGGKRILFDRRGPRRDRIWIVGAAGRNAALLTHGRDPSWAPGGRRFVYICEQTNAEGRTYSDLCSYHLSTARVRPLMVGRLGLYVRDSAWAPDGGRIAFGRAVVEADEDQYEQMYDVFTVRPDGSGLRRLTGTPRVNEAGPQWAPGGRRLVFARYGEWCYDCTDFPELFGLSTIRRDGDRKRALPNSIEEEPAWSPDGTMIVASRPLFDEFNDNPKPGVWLLTPQGSHIRRISGPITQTGYERGGGLDWQTRPAPRSPSVSQGQTSG